MKRWMPRILWWIVYLLWSIFLGIATGIVTGAGVNPYYFAASLICLMLCFCFEKYAHREYTPRQLFRALLLSQFVFTVVIYIMFATV